MRTKRWVFVLCLGLAVALVHLHAQSLPVVPGGYGYGMATRAAYACGTDPTLYRVTSLNDSGAGTLRAALDASGPRVIVFERSGYINLSSDINITNPCLTVAGQTAPSPGITIRMVDGGLGNSEAMILINTHDVLFQHLRIRPGWPSGNTICNSAILAYGYPAGEHYNVVLDHMSVSWAQDEGVYSGPTEQNSGNANFTLWRSITAEGLWDADTSTTCTGGVGSEPANGHNVFMEGNQADVIQSLMSSSRERNPMMAGGNHIRLLNNIIYQWQGEWGFFSFNHYDQGPYSLTTVGNRFIVGPESNNVGVGGAIMYWYGLAAHQDSSWDAGNAHYKSDDTVSNSFGTTIITTHNEMDYNPVVGSPPSGSGLPSGYTPLGSTTLETALLPVIGARPLDRDDVDTRIIADVTNRTGGFITNETDVGDYPTLAVNSHTFTLPSNPHTVTLSGYTNLEVALHDLATAIEQGSPRPPGPDDVPPAAGKLITSASFTGTSGTPLTSYTSETGGGWTQHPVASASFQLSDANRLMNTVTNVPALTFSNAISLSPQVDIAVDAYVYSLLPGGSYSIFGHLDPTTTTAEFVNIDVDSLTASIRTVVNDVYTDIASCSISLPTSTTQHFTFRLRPATRHFVVNGTQCTSTDIVTVSTAGRSGLSAYETTDPSTTSAGIHFDNFTVTDVANTCDKCRLRFVR